MTMEPNRPDHLFGLLRLALAALAPRLLLLVQPMRGIGVEEVESQYLDLRNNSTASDRQVQRMLERLEQDCVALSAFLGRQPQGLIPVLLTDGNAPAYADRGTLYVLDDAQSIEMPQDEEELYDFFRAVMEGGSFVCWLVAGYGWDVVWGLRAGGDPEAVVGVPLYQLEERWLAAIAAQDLQPKTCLLAVPGNPVFRGLCRRLDESMSEQ